MKPQSIKLFDRLFLGSLVLGVVNFAAFFDETMALLEADPAVTEMGLGAGFMIGSFAVGMIISLILWAFISLRRSKIAMWILVALTGIGVISLPMSLADIGTAQAIATVALTAMQVAALVFLFRADAKEWFERKGEPKVDPSTFE